MPLNPTAPSPPYAHSAKDGEPWEELFTPFGTTSDTQCAGKLCLKCEHLDRSHGHTNKVAFWAARFAAGMFPPGSPESKTAWTWGWLTGLWHDLGKFAPIWQAYLKSKADPHLGEISGKVDHSTAGAILTHGTPPFGDLISYLIAGHHAGLADGCTLFPEGTRLSKRVELWRTEAEAAGIPLKELIPPPPLTRPQAGNDAMAFMLRYFFSCLVDADWLATESFMQPEKTLQREAWPEDIIDRMLTALEEYLVKKFGVAESNPVNDARETVRRDCEAAAENPSGRFFSLTVPTGGGKTLSSLLFALRHARKNGLRRVLFVIPFTSIIKQNADVFRDAFSELSKELGREIVLEHHSKFDPAKETEANRRTAENWDSPLIVTTNVRFFESLFANRPGDCRKLHRTARSVIIFDEVQALPNHLLAPILRALTCLVKDFGTTAVLCTATQPALEKREDFHVGIPPEDITPIIRDEAALFTVLERVECHPLGAIDDDSLIRHIRQNAAQGCLLILNTTKASQTLHKKLSDNGDGPRLSVLHLSARMCPAHVVEVLKDAKILRKAGEPVVLVSTQIIEAGVDISFPVVYRAECGLDSFAQAAGRCNRHGELAPAKGQVFLFQPSDHPIPKALTDLIAAAAVTRTQILPNHTDSELLSPAAIRAYFEHAIWQAGPKTDQWDKAHIISGSIPCFNPTEKSANWAKSYSFKTAAQKFRMIDSETHAVLIPWNDAAKKLADEIRQKDRFNIPLSLDHYRLAQQFSVQVYDHEWKQMQNLLSLHCGEAIAILTHPENDYHEKTGLKRPETPDNPNAFCV
ncbi:MAG: CRISPR-associated helicase Cas3' [Verrucomicrobiota bacterium]